MKNKALKAFATFIALVFLGLAAGCGGGGSDVNGSINNPTSSALNGSAQ